MIKKSLILSILFFLTISLFGQENVVAEKEPLYQQIKKSIQHKAFTISPLVQSGGRFSLKDDSFLGGKTFSLYNARLVIKGKIDGGFFYKFQFNFAKEPNLLDALIGYQYSKALKISMGAMKPLQTQDFIPSPAATDFIDRSKIGGLLTQSRELGLAVQGDIGGLFYFVGFFNGNKVAKAKKDSYYGIGRLQYNLKGEWGKLQFAVQSSYGNSDKIRNGSTGPELRGKRFIYGADVRLQTSKILFAAEYMDGNLETKNFLDKKEKINGYYITAGYQIVDKSMILARWQNWNEKTNGLNNNMLTVGLNQTFTKIMSGQLNFDMFLPDGYSENKYGISFLIQMNF